MLKSTYAEGLDNILQAITYIQSISDDYWQHLYRNVVYFKRAKSDSIHPSRVNEEYYCDQILKYLVGTNILVKNSLFDKEIVTNPNKLVIRYVYYQILGITSKKSKN